MPFFIFFHFVYFGSIIGRTFRHNRLSWRHNPNIPSDVSFDFPRVDGDAPEDISTFSDASARAYYASTRAYYASEDITTLNGGDEQMITQLQRKLLNYLSSGKLPYDDSASF